MIKFTDKVRYEKPYYIHKGIKYEKIAQLELDANGNTIGDVPVADACMDTFMGPRTRFRFFFKEVA